MSKTTSPSEIEHHSLKFDTDKVEDIESQRCTHHHHHNKAPGEVVPTRPPPVDGSIIGILSFGAACIVISFYNCRPGGLTNGDAVIALCLTLATITQFTGGIFEMVRGSTYTGTVFLFYSMFWLSYGFILLPGVGVGASYADQPDMLGTALGIYFTMFTFLTFLFMIVGIRKTITLFVVLSSLDLTFLLLALTNFTGNLALGRAAGIVGLVPGLAAVYMGIGGLLALEPNPIIVFPQGRMRV
ncbi:hypothetical protein CYLTODRAFT_453263 [Cylindrobasidium torrendii FP15055 ss-10]|uniref:Gpr1 family protein n=1 Tax=Cylindrobasidium torrendii FP15055 ss-10 TaxID=1314674 RepID=A0A0D7BF18_9AGAR|nr:hypothetical protein CYLTODRAFT_453263 [Cylindrobasidium torrendii FP15055 ss-10]